MTPEELLEFNRLRATMGMPGGPWSAPGSMMLPDELEAPAVPPPAAVRRAAPVAAAPPMEVGPPEGYEPWRAEGLDPTMAAGGLAGAPPPDGGGGGLSGFLGGLGNAARAAWPYIRPVARVAADTAINLAAGDPSAAARMRLARDESEQRSAALEIRSSRERLKQIRELAKQSILSEAARRPPQNAAEQRALAMRLAPFDSSLAATFLKPPAIREFQQGSQNVTVEQQPDGTWTRIGGGPRWNPESGGFQLGWDEAGRPIVSMGRGGLPVATTTRTDLEKKIIGAQDALASYEEIESRFQPEFQQWPTRVEVLWDSWKSKSGMDLDEESRTRLEQYSEYRSAAYDSMSRTLNLLSGAAISPAEFERLKSFLPNVGTGLTDGDDPIDFASKLRRLKRASRLAILRHQYELRNGLGIGESGLSISDPAGLARLYGRERIRTLVDQGVPREDAEQQAAAYIEQLFQGLE